MSQPTKIGNSSNDFASSAIGAGTKAASFAGKTISSGVSHVKDIVHKNSWGMKLVSLLGAAAVFIVAILGLAQVLGTASGPSFYLFNAYMVLFSFLIILVELNDSTDFTRRINEWIFSQFGFLRTNFGRGAYFIFLGIVWFGAWGLLWGLLGLYLILAGFLYMGLNSRAANASTDGHQRQVDEVEIS